MNGIVGAVGDAGRRDLFYLDEDFHLKQRTWNGQEWVIQWIDHGGIFTSVPAVVSRSTPTGRSSSVTWGTSRT